MNLYPRISEPANLWMAYRFARRGKRNQPAVAAFEYSLEDNLVSLRTELLNQTYQPRG